jgi:L-2-hydroxycarboxylate dehydrogenase (NAD+)
LNGAAMGKDVIDFNADDQSVTNTGHSIIAINIEAFMPLAEFRKQVDVLVCDLRASKLMPGVDHIRMPGEGSHKARVDNEKMGVPVPTALLQALNTLASELGIAPLVK